LTGVVFSIVPIVLEAALCELTARLRAGAPLSDDREEIDELSPSAFAIACSDERDRPGDGAQRARRRSRSAIPSIVCSP
jgi:hypothetical protein